MCACLVEGAPDGSISLTGTGQFNDPYLLTADISADAGNTISQGTDGGLYAGTFLGVLVYDVAGTAEWTKAANPEAKWLRVSCVGSGGGSASTGATLAGQGIARGGGAGGSCGTSWLDVATLTPSVTVTVAAGGAGGSPAGTATAGGAGGTSSFGAYVTGRGGAGSSASVAPGVPPLVSTGGGFSTVGTADLTVLGTRGDAGIIISVGVRIAGAGGLAGGGMSQGGIANFNPGTGAAGGRYGTGGSGSVSEGASGGFVGAAGGDGVVIVEMFG